MPPTTKDRLLDAAIGLVIAKGYEAMTLDQVCEDAGVTKGALFHHFQGKEHLVRAATDQAWAAWERMRAEAGYGERSDPLERVYGFIEFIAESYRPREEPGSCYFGNLTQELANNRPSVRVSCLEGFSRWAEWFVDDLEHAAARRPGLHVDAPSLSRHIISVYEGSLILAKAYQDPAIVVEGMEHLRRYLESIFEPRNNASRPSARK